MAAGVEGKDALDRVSILGGMLFSSNGSGQHLGEYISVGLDFGLGPWGRLVGPSLGPKKTLTNSVNALTNSVNALTNR